MAAPAVNITHQIVIEARSINQPKTVLIGSSWMVYPCFKWKKKEKGESKISRKGGKFPAFDLFLQNISRNVKEI